MIHSTLCCLLAISSSQLDNNSNFDLAKLSNELQSGDSAKAADARRQLGEYASMSSANRALVWEKCNINTTGMQFVLAKTGSFVMGPDNHRIFEQNCEHHVQITVPFYVCITETTNRQYKQLIPDAILDREYSQDDDSPVVGRNFDEILRFCEVLSQLEGVKYRIPTEAEWEYSCRAGSKERYSFGADSSLLPKYGWFKQPFGALRVGQLQPNDWGIYDMHGNAEELVSDWYSSTYYSECNNKGVVKDPQGPLFGRNHTLRGGNWYIHDPVGLASSFRRPLPLVTININPSKPSLMQLVGFRIVREFTDKELQLPSSNSIPLP